MLLMPYYGGGYVCIGANKTCMNWAKAWGG
jgi:hypothetical protein